jgi:hypothetical protein
MQLQKLRLLSAALIAVYPTSADAGNAQAAPINQTTAQIISANNMAKASNDSIDECTRHAMSAVMHVASLSFPTAMSEGYHALDNYINSTKMDKIEVRNKRLQQSLSSVADSQNGRSIAGASSGASSPPSSGISGRTVGERDTAFLYKGETGRIAEEFERRTGMKRETFFSQMASGLDSDLTFTDPEVIPKLEARYENFMRAIPNEDFKKGIRTAESLVPVGGKQFGLGTVYKYFTDSFKEDKAPAAPDVIKSSVTVAAAAPAPVEAEPAPEVAAPDSCVVASVPAASFQAPTALDPDAPRSFSRTDSLAGGQRPLIGLKTEDGLNEYFANNPSMATAEDSIFKIVSKRYKLLSPNFQKIH